MHEIVPGGIRIERCPPERFDDARTLLISAGLPVEDVTPDLVELYVALSPDGKVVGCGGMERHGETALLRSLAVVPDRRGAWIGASIARRVLEEAQASGVRDALVLTAKLRPSLVWRFGFHPAKRAQFEARMADSVSWQHLPAPKAKLYHCDLRAG